MDAIVKLENSSPSYHEQAENIRRRMLPLLTQLAELANEARRQGFIPIWGTRLNQFGVEVPNEIIMQRHY